MVGLRRNVVADFVADFVVVVVVVVVVGGGGGGGGGGWFVSFVLVLVDSGHFVDVDGHFADLSLCQHSLCFSVHAL